MMWEKFKEFVRAIKKEIKVYQCVIRDKRTPVFPKILLGLAIGYLVMPFELIPDFIPVIGYLDDVIIVGLLVFLAVRMIPKQVIEDARRRLE